MSCYLTVISRWLYYRFRRFSSIYLLSLGTGYYCFLTFASECDGILWVGAHYKIDAMSRAVNLYTVSLVVRL